MLVTFCWAILSYLFSWNNKYVYITGTKLAYILTKLNFINIKYYGVKPSLYTKNIYISNHRHVFDIYILFLTGGILNKIIAPVMKSSITLIPFIGWWVKLQKFPIINRNKQAINFLNNYRTKNDVLIFPEGTRYSYQKYMAKKELSDTLSLNDQVLVPKHRGLYSLLSNNEKNNIYIQTIIYDNQYFPRNIKIHFQKINNNLIPKEEKAFKLWLIKEFKIIGKIVKNPDYYLKRELDLNIKFNKNDLYSILNLILNALIIYFFYKIGLLNKFILIPLLLFSTFRVIYANFN